MMRIEEYLQQLCASLDVDLLRRDEIRLEAHQHLRERAESLMEEGLNLAEAEERAVAEFGPPEQVARQLSSSLGPAPLTKSAKQVGWAALAFAIYGGLLVAVAVPLGLYGLAYVGPNRLWLWLWPAILLVMGLLYVGCGMALRQHRAWARLPVIVLSILSLASFPGLFVGAYALWTMFNPRTRLVLQ